MDQKQGSELHFLKRIKVPANSFASDILELGGRKIVNIAYKVENNIEKQVFCTRCYPPSNNLTSWDVEFYNNEAADYYVIVEGVTGF